MCAKVDYCSVTERDMDTLFLSAFATDENFVKLFLEKTDLNYGSFVVENVILSKADSDGESDITVLLKVGNQRIALLIEDKINAIAMEEQCNRYSIRGKKGIKNNEYADFRIFIVCPEKYYENNEEAKKYAHHVFYEECLDYLKKNPSPINEIRIQQLEQAIDKAKHQSNTEFNADANAFFNKYVEYQKQKYPELDLATKADTSNGYWPHFRTTIKDFYISHKTNFGNVDLTIPALGVKTSDMEILENLLHKYGFTEIKVLKKPKAKSFFIRIDVQSFELTSTFFRENEMYPIFDECFQAVRRLLEITKLFEAVINITK